MCSEILTKENIAVFINKKTYKVLEQKINEFRKLRKKNKLNTDMLFEQWSKQKDNYAFVELKNIIINRSTVKERRPASIED